MNEAALTAQLHREDFLRVYVWEDGPNAGYPVHTHGTEAAHIILTGEMTLTMAGESRTLRSGERCERRGQRRSLCGDGPARLSRARW